MDSGEIAAGLAHETAHLRRRHRPVLVAASVLATIARPLPGTAAAERQLSFQLERDADAAAVRHLNDPLALASAICKVAGSQAPAGAAGLGGSGPVTQRVAELLDGSGSRSRAVDKTARLLAVALGVVAVALTLSTAAWAFDAGAGAPGHHCTHDQHVASDAPASGARQT
jgi:beta-lactamase regulating signal transducer with metallopeptidase domain